MPLPAPWLTRLRERFLDVLFPLRTDEKIVREISEETFVALMAPALIALPALEAAALLPYRVPAVRAAIHEAKYRGNARAFTLLAAALTDYLHERDEGFRTCRLLPVPLSAERLSARGFNQVHEVARGAAEALGLPVDTQLLLRTRDTPSQVSLPRHLRHENMHGAFRATQKAESDCTYILLDDVVTTGATLAAAAKALRAAGAAHVTAIALAH